MNNEGASQSPKDQALADLVVLAFFFLLRVGEYTPLGSRETRTTQIRRKDLQFWRERPSGVMDRLSLLSTLDDHLTADSVAVTLDNRRRMGSATPCYTMRRSETTHSAHAKLQHADSSPCAKPTPPIQMPSSAYTPPRNIFRPPKWPGFYEKPRSDQ